MRSEYVTAAGTAALVDRLSDRDRRILLDLARVRVLSGQQLTRLHFAELAPESRDRTRRRVLARLADWQLVVTLERTVGGARAGSAGHIYSLGVAGQRALPFLIARSDEEHETYMDARPARRSRTPSTPGMLFIAHALAIAELYVKLREHERAHDLVLAHFGAEPATWCPDGQGGVMKPDAYVRVQTDGVEDSWWIEADRATESLPALRRQLLAYVDFVRRGALGPGGIVPRVLVTVPHDRRLAAVRDLVAALPTPGAELIAVVRHDRAAALMITTLRS